mgnify:CR=1 FL=1
MDFKLAKTGFCLGCQREYPIDEFYPKLAEDEFVPTHVLPYCEHCCNEMVNKFLEKSGSLESAVWFTCAKLDIPFIKQCFDLAVEEKNRYIAKSTKDKTDKDYPIFKYYYNYLWGSKSKRKSTDFWECFCDSDNLNPNQAQEETERKIDEKIDELKMDWGEQESIDDYRFLIHNYKKYTEGITISPKQEDMFRDLCLARLEKRKIEEGRKSGDLTKSQGRILTLMNRLKLDEVASDKPKTMSEQFCTENIKKHEYHDPCEFYQDKKRWDDVNGWKKYFKDCVLRPLLNTLANQRDFSISLDDVEKYQNLE